MFLRCKKGSIVNNVFTDEEGNDYKLINASINKITECYLLLEKIKEKYKIRKILITIK